LAYAIRLEAKPWERDKIFAAYGARLFVDPKSLE
jgi:Fe-S cluster assembly iron-binding protein IscA